MKIVSLRKPQHIEEKVYKEMLTYVSKDKARRVSQFYYLDDAYRTLLGDLLIRSEICKMLNISNDSIRCKYNESGKPYLIDESLCFNLTHSKDWIVAMFDKRPVGIDVEYINEFNIKKIIDFFSNEEILELNNRPESEKLEYFYDLWTLKESYVKCIGEGLFIPLDSFTIIKNYNEIRIKHNTSEKYYFKQYDIAPFYKLSVCSTSENLPQSIEYRDLSEIQSILSLSSK